MLLHSETRFAHYSTGQFAGPVLIVYLFRGEGYLAQEQWAGVNNSLIAPTMYIALLGLVEGFWVGFSLPRILIAPCLNPGFACNSSRRLIALTSFLTGLKERG